MTATLQKTPLNDLHIALGARMVEFAGWSMPIQYTGVIEEHEIVRSHAGLFDLTHMAEFEVKGADAERFVQEMTSEVIPMLVNIMGFNLSFVDAIKKSQDRMQQAVKQATSQAQTLMDVFGQIY